MIPAPHHRGPPRAAGRRRAAALLALTPLLLMGTGCAGPQAAEATAGQPAVDLRRYFDGPLTAHGVVLDRSGDVRERFTVRLTGRWQGDTGTLDEQFRYADGRTESRTWTLQRGADGRYTGTAADVIGQAEGRVAGRSFSWRYTLRLPVGGRTWDIDFDDRMHWIDGRVMLNRAVMSKFGIRVGEVLLSFSPERP